MRDLEATFTAPICGLIGPNGAGKTTLLNVISGFVTPKSGEVCIEGEDILSLPPAARFRAGLRRSFQTEQVVDDLTVYDNLLAACDQLGLDGTAASAEITRALHHCGLVPVVARLGSALNLFERRMVEIGKALVGWPRVILLDEPGAGMSEQESAILRERLLAIPDRFGCQILLIDHDVDLISATCTETLVLDFGEKLAFGPTAQVLADDKVRNAYLGVE
ncbi:MAG: ATP-binding cassette domain-containing protein [Tabrizicola sp.]|nr:ATP-binding cassette domain-containing protein [Tabrizicola sp.]